MKCQICGRFVKKPNMFDTEKCARIYWNDWTERMAKSENNERRKEEVK